MVVDDVEDHADPVTVRLVDEEAEVVRLAVEVGGGEEVDPVIAPAEGAGKLADRHHLDRRDPDPGQVREPGGGGTPGALGREGADVQLVEHLAPAVEAAPAGIAPSVAAGVDHRRGPERPLGLPAGGGIGAGLAIVEAEPVAVAVTEARDGAGEVAARLSRERHLLAVPEDDRDAARRRRPDAGVGAGGRGLDPDRQTPDRMPGPRGSGLRRCHRSVFPPPHSLSDNPRPAERVPGGWRAPGQGRMTGGFAGSGACSTRRD